VLLADDALVGAVLVVVLVETAVDVRPDDEVEKAVVEPEDAVVLEEVVELEDAVVVGDEVVATAEESDITETVLAP